MATKTISFEPIAETTVRMTLIGDSQLVLHKKTRSFEQQEIFKQSHPKGTKIPARFMQDKNLWETLITSITWLHPIDFHDENWALYTEDEWRTYMTENAPCILAPAFMGSFREAFTSFFKDATGKAGTDFQRGVNLHGTLFPITFAEVTWEEKLVPNTGLNKTNVLCQQNVFNGWSCDIELSCVNSLFPIETIIQVVEAAGRYIGVGTQRKNGRGRFHIDKSSLVEVIS